MSDAVEAKDGPVGSVSWASYLPGESYLVVSYREGPPEVHHVVPAGAVRAVDHERGAVTLGVTVAEVKATPAHENPDAPVDWGTSTSSSAGCSPAASSGPTPTFESRQRLL